MGDKEAKVITASIKDKAVLYATYMQFTARGGLFIPTTRVYEMGDEVQLNISLIDDPEKYSIKGKVVWVTPSGAQGNRAAGIGLQFDDEESITLRNKIETLLAGMLTSGRSTHTM